MRYLQDSDEYSHPVGPESNWSESRYLDVYDRDAGVGVWFRLGNLPHADRSDASLCVTLPNGTAALVVTQHPNDHSELCWEVVTPFRESRISYEGEAILLTDPWVLTDPKRAFQESKRAGCRIDLQAFGCGLPSVMGRDQDDIQRILLPGQADGHFQHLVHTSGTVTVGGETISIAGRGGRDHSWGPRNWLAKRYFRWLTAAFDDDFGFMLTRAVGPGRQTRSGFVWEDGHFHLVDDFVMTNSYSDSGHAELLGVRLSIASGPRSWEAVGRPESWLPLRHRAPGGHRGDPYLRIIKSCAEWRSAGVTGEGMLEYHDLMIEGRPAGLHD